MKRANELGFSGRYNLLVPVIKESFAFSFMAKKSVGRYWKTLEESQQKQLLDTYTHWSIATYARNFNAYQGEIFEVLPETELHRDTVTVVSRLMTTDRENVDFHYRLRKPDSKWVIVDIQISGVSQLALTRSQFIRVIKHEGFDALIHKLQDKISVLSHPVSE
jgi:phospholipid transport system substrate-binding protein